MNPILDWDTRTLKKIQEIRTRDDNDNPIIEGYFVVFDGVYHITDGVTESIDRHAFDNTIDGKDIRILTDHDSKLVLGRTTAGTAQIRVDNTGVWGHVDINPNDTDAMNAHARVERGDISQGSFGFNILSEDTDIREDGSIHWTLKDIELYEVSCCTFPAYTETNISAREHDREAIRKREREAWQQKMLTKLKGENHGA